jgi:hypothetical protein
MSQIMWSELGMFSFIMVSEIIHFSPRILSPVIAKVFSHIRFSWYVNHA